MPACRIRHTATLESLPTRTLPPHAPPQVKGFFFDFIFAALTGGGVAAFLALSKGGVGEAGTKLGEAVKGAVDSAAAKLG